MFALSQCKKDNPDNNLTIGLDKTTYYPYEIALFKTEGITLAEQTYNATINGTTYTVYNVNGSLAFAMPDLPQSDYAIVVNIAGKDYESNFSMMATPAIADPDVIVDEMVNKGMLQVTRLATYADSLDNNAKNAVKADLQKLQAALDSLNNAYAALSATDKLECARFLAANNAWMDEIHIATMELLTASSAFKTDDAISDYESRVKTAMAKFTNAQINIGEQVAKLAILTGAGFAIGSVVPVLGTAVGGGIGATIGAYLLVTDLKAAHVAQEDLLNCALVPFQELFTGKINSTVSFQNGISKEMITTMKYRSLYSTDKNSSLSIVSTFIGDCATIKSLWEQVKPSIPASLFTFLPRTVDDIPTYRTETHNVHGKYLSVSGISNAQVQLTSSTIDEGFIVLKFANNAATAQQFSFNLLYESDGLGTLNTNIDADITTSGTVSTLDSNLIGTWKCTTWQRQDYQGVFKDYLNRQSVYNTSTDEAVCADVNIHPNVTCTSTYTVDDLRITMSAVPFSSGRYQASSFMSETRVECSTDLDGQWVPCEPYTMPPSTYVLDRPNTYFKINSDSVLIFGDGSAISGVYQLQGPSTLKITNGAGSEYQIFQKQ